MCWENLPDFQRGSFGETETAFYIIKREFK